MSALGLLCNEFGSRRDLTGLLPCRHGIPMRLFVRYLRRFAMDLDQVHASDRDGILRPG